MEMIMNKFVYPFLFISIVITYGCGARETGPPPFEKAEAEMMEETLEISKGSTEETVPSKDTPSIQIIDLEEGAGGGERIAEYITARGYEIKDWVRASGPYYVTKIYYREDFKEDARKMARHLEGRQFIEAIEWNSPYDIIVFVGVQPEERGRIPTAKSTAPETKEKQIKREIKTDINYYVNAKRYFKVYKIEINGYRGEIYVYLEKLIDQEGWFPRLSLKIYRKGDVLVTEDTWTVDAFKGKPKGHKEKGTLSFSPDIKVESMEIDVKVYDEKGSLVLY